MPTYLRQLVGSPAPQGLWEADWPSETSGMDKLQQADQPAIRPKCSPETTQAWADPGAAVIGATNPINQTWSLHFLSDSLIDGRVFLKLKNLED